MFYVMFPLFPASTPTKPNLIAIDGKRESQNVERSGKRRDEKSLRERRGGEKANY